MTTIAGYALATTLAVLISSLAHGIDAAQASAMRPLSELGTELLVSRTLAVSGVDPTASDSAALAAEQNAVDQANLLDISKLGSPGTQFSHDFFLPATLPTFPEDTATQIERLPTVRNVARGLVVDLVRREGLVPQIVATFTIPSQVINLTGPTSQEQATTDACVAKLPAQQQNAVGVYGCLPQRLRQVQTAREVLRQVLGAPHTDIRTTYMRLGGVDLLSQGQGLLTGAAIVHGAFLSGIPGSHEVVISEGYAESMGLGVGSSLDLRGESFIVVGISRPQVGGIACDIYLPLEQLQQLAERQGRINVVLVRAHDSSVVHQLGRQIAGIFPAASVTDASQSAAMVSGSLTLAGDIADFVRVVLVGLVLLGAGGYGWLLTQSAVRSRTAELSVLRAIGWSRADVTRQVLAESVILGAIGTIIGTAVGIGVALGAGRLAPTLDVYDVLSSVRQSVRVVPLVDAHEVGAIVLVALTVALVAASLGGLKASRVAPSRGLRDIE